VLNTDRDVVKEYTTSKFEEHKDEEYEYEFKESEYKFNTDRDIAKEHITFSDTEWLEELETLAVEEIIAKYVNYSTMISEERPVKQPPAHSSPAHSSSSTDHRNPAHSSPAHSSPAHSSPAKQPPAQFKTPAFAQALAKQGLHKKTGAKDMAHEDQQQDLAPEDQNKTWHKKTSTDLAQEAHQTEKMPPDNTMVGLIGGPEPVLQMGGQDHSLQLGGQIKVHTIGGTTHGLYYNTRRGGR
jgi:hypothetical protein